MAYKFIVTTILIRNLDKIVVDNITPATRIFDEEDLEKAIAWSKLESDKDKHNIEVEVVYEEHPAYKACVDRIKASGNKFSNIPYSKYIIRVERMMDNGGVTRTNFITTISYHNI